MLKPESIQRKEMNKTIWDFETQTNHQIPTRRPALMIAKKERTCRLVEFAFPAEHRMKIKEKEERQVLRPCQWTKKNCYWCARNNPQKVVKRAVSVGNSKTSREIQTAALLRSVRILRRVLVTWGDLMSLRLQWKTVS